MRFTSSELGWAVLITAAAGVIAVVPKRKFKRKEKPESEKPYRVTSWKRIRWNVLKDKDDE